jgi:hypothetical protein
MLIDMANADQSLILYYNQNAEQSLLQSGYDNMSVSDKNSLVVVIANKENVLYSEVTYDYILQYHKNLKIATLSQNCEDAIVAGFTSTLNNHVYRTNRDDQLNMIGQKGALDADPNITTVSWKTEDAGYIDHTRADWLEIYGEAFTHKKTQLTTYNTRKQAVNTATTHDGIVAVTWAGQ